MGVFGLRVVVTLVRLANRLGIVSIVLGLRQSIGRLLFVCVRIRLMSWLVVLDYLDSLKADVSICKIIVWLRPL